MGSHARKWHDEPISLLTHDPEFSDFLSKAKEELRIIDQFLSRVTVSVFVGCHKRYPFARKLKKPRKLNWQSLLLTKPASAASA